MTADLTGTTLEGRYAIQSILGSGGFGSVYLAHQLDLNRKVAVKVMHPCGTAGADEEALARFEREARVLGSLSQENIVAIYSFGMLPDHGFYMVMEYLEGQSLADNLAACGGRLPPERVARLGLQLTMALDEAHKNGVVHRDLKPQNIILVNKPDPDTVKVVDFGLSRLLPDSAREVQKLTQTGALVGSIHYMSPEMCMGQRATASSDLYAAGCILYECLAGKPPFESDNPIALLHKHRQEQPGPLKMTDLPGLEAVIFKALMKDPMDRYRSAREMHDDLEALIGGKPEQMVAKEIPSSISRSTTQSDSKPAVLIIGTVSTACVAAFLYLQSPANRPAIHPDSKLSERALLREQSITEGRRLAAESQRQLQSDSRNAPLPARRALAEVGKACSKELYTEKSALDILEILRLLKPVFKVHSTSIRQPAATRALESIYNNDLPRLTRQKDYDEMGFLITSFLASNGHEESAARHRYFLIDNYLAANDVQKARLVLASTKKMIAGDDIKAKAFLYISEIDVLAAENKVEEAKKLFPLMKECIHSSPPHNRERELEFLQIELERADKLGLVDEGLSIIEEISKTEPPEPNPAALSSYFGLQKTEKEPEAKSKAESADPEQSRSEYIKAANLLRTLCPLLKTQQLQVTVRKRLTVLETHLKDLEGNNLKVRNPNNSLKV